MQDFDLIAIGDLAADAFIRLDDLSLGSKVSKENRHICFNFGDKVPYQSVTVVPAAGNSINVAIGAARLGLATALVSNVGDDKEGHEALIDLQKEQVNTRWVRINEDTKTNYHYVLWYNEDRTILIKHEKVPYELPTLSNTSWIYLSSLGEESLSIHEEIANFLENNPETRLAFQPGTFQLRMGKNNLRGILNRTSIFFSNLEEAMTLSETKEKDPWKLLEAVKNLGPKVVVITDADQGSYAHDGEKAWHQPICSTNGNFLERTGAGDSFAAAFLAAYHLGKEIPEALAWGAINSKSVVEEIGPQRGLLTRESLEEQFSKVQEEIKAQELVKV